MRIHEQNLTGAAASGAPAEAQRNGRADGSASSAGSRADRVELSGAVGAISRALTADGAGRAGRVRELAAQYQAGGYRAEPAATSRAMVADALAAAVA